MRIDSLTDVGKKRNENQDNYWSAILDVDGNELGVICVCDGMGGLSNGSLVSRKVVKVVKDYFIDNISVEGLVNELNTVNNEINSTISKDSLAGTTCTVVCCYKGEYWVLHIGDSRCYHKEGNKVKLLTEDHTVIEKYRRLGKELPDSMVKKYKNVLTRCIGVVKDANYDIVKGTYSTGDFFLVCSDGFWHSLEEVHFSDGSLSNLEGMVSRCMGLGETDNITVCMLGV